MTAPSGPGSTGSRRSSTRTVPPGSTTTARISGRPIVVVGCVVAVGVDAEVAELGFGHGVVIFAEAPWAHSVDLPAAGLEVGVLDSRVRPHRRGDALLCASVPVLRRLGQRLHGTRSAVDQMGEAGVDVAH